MYKFLKISDGRCLLAVFFLENYRYGRYGTNSSIKIGLNKCCIY